jgi:hypothetical protein
MVSSRSAVINRLKGSDGDRRAVYRIINNKKWSMDEFVKPLYEECSRNASGFSHVLCVQDTTELNYDNIRGRIDAHDEDFGYGTHKDSLNSLFIHPSLVLNASNGLPLGFSSLKIWGRGNRPTRGTHERKSIPIQEKESFRWLDSALTTAEYLPSHVRKTMVGDRENDVYEVICGTLQCGCDFLIRSSSDRTTTSDNRKLSEIISQTPVACTYEFPLIGRKGRQNRTAIMELRFTKVILRAPGSALSKVSDELQVWCIHTKEKKESVPEGEEPIEWRLLTSHEVSTVSQAMECIGWYKLRWTIESLFRVVKSKGFSLDAAQIESGAAMKKLIGMAFVAAFRVMALKTAHEEQLEDIPARIIFTEEQLAIMRSLLPGLEPQSKKATKGMNPHKEGSLPWAAWIVAMLAGGWSGRLTDKNKPGYIKFLQGWEKLETIMWAIKEMKINVYKD